MTKSKTESDAEVSRWSIRILAQCHEARDNNNLAAVADHASLDWDRSDFPEPPVIGDYVSVYFPHPEWQKSIKKFTTDFRPYSEDGYTWEFDVRTNIRDKIELTFEGVTDIPAGLQVWLVDEAVLISTNLREYNQYAVAGRGPENPTRLKLIVGKADFIAQNLRGTLSMPTAYELAQNFPNPFNPATTIRYGLPQDDRVTLRVFNLLGEEVVTLISDADQRAGYHVVVWDGRNQRHQPVASGVYLYRLRTERFSMVKKMLLVK